MNLGSFFSELKRRNIYKVAVAYAVVGSTLEKGRKDQDNGGRASVIMTAC